MPSRKREDRAERDELLCQLARQLPEKDRESPVALARWLLDLRGRRFVGLAALIADADSRERFEAWVKLGTPTSLAKAAGRAFSDQPGSSSGRVTPEVPEQPRITLPPLLWPFGARQRKDAEPKFKLPLLYGYPAGSERIFYKCLGEKTLHDVSATIQGRPVGYSPAVSPGEFIELTWKDDSQLAGLVTYNGWRDWILQYESFKDLAGLSSGDDNSPTAQALRPTREFAARQVERIGKVLPPDLDNWRRKVWEYRLEIRYADDGGARSGQLTGTLLMTMENLWSRFRDEKGHETPIR